MSKIKTHNMVLCALFAALSALISPWSISVGAVPISFVHVSIFAACGVLGLKRALISQFIFVILGVAGLPVFSGFSGGFGKLAGPTGGYIFGYLICTAVLGWLVDVKGRGMLNLILSMSLGILLTHISGFVWLCHYLKIHNFTAVLCSYVLPFLPGDIFKVILSAFLVNKFVNYKNLSKNGKNTHAS